MTRSKILIYLSVLLIFVSCNTGRDTNVKPRRPDKGDMEELNRYLVQKDREVIQNYIERKGLKMIESSTGLWYMITNEGQGEYFKVNDRLRMNYECHLLDGTLCYSSEVSGPKEIVIGRTELEAGLNEGLKLLKPGAEATFILPPFLAYGLIGDGKKIPPRTTIVYNISILR